MKIITNSNNYEGKVLYKMTKSQSINKLSTLTESVTVSGFVLFEDDKNDNVVEILSLETNSGVFATNSATFKETFLDIVEMMGTPVEIVVGHGTSKNGREYIYCDIV